MQPQKDNRAPNLTLQHPCKSGDLLDSNFLFIFHSGKNPLTLKYFLNNHNNDKTPLIQNHHLGAEDGPTCSKRPW